MKRNFQKNNYLSLIIIIAIVLATVGTVRGKEPEYLIADYKLTFQEEGNILTGKSTLSEENITDTIQTKYGKYSNVVKIGFSATKLTGIAKSDIVNFYISEWYYYADYDKGFIFYSQMTSGNSSTLSNQTTLKAEYSKPNIIDKNSIEIREYAQREQEDANNWTESNIREEIEIAINQTKTVEAGTFQTEKLTDKHYKNGTYIGMEIGWVNKNGITVKSVQFDEQNISIFTVEATKVYDKNTLKTIIPSLNIELLLLIVLGLVLVWLIKKRI